MGRHRAGLAVGLAVVFLGAAFVPSALAGPPAMAAAVALDNDLTAPAQLEFGRQVTGRTSPEHTVDVTATGTSATTISSIELSGANETDFAITTDSCTSAVLDPDEKCTIGVTFTPGAVGGRDTGLVVHADTVAGGITIEPEGIGIESSVAPLTLDIGSVALGDTGSGIVTLTNGLDAQSIDGFSIDFGDEVPFTVRPASGCTALATIASLATCDITIDFRPLAAGGYFAHLRGTLGGFRPIEEVALYGTGLPSSHVTWGPARTVRGASWTRGNGLARSLKSTTTYLHAMFATDYIGGRYANDASPRVGIYYRRSSTGGRTWTTSTRINPTTTHAARGAVTASGSRVYAFYVTQTRWIHYSRTAPRVLYLRTNTNYGSSASWGAPKRLTSTTGRIDFPAAAASLGNVYVAYTDSVQGNVRVAISHNRGASFTTRTLGTTSWSTSDGKAGYPSVAAYGSLVVVSWTSASSGKVVVSISKNAGVTWQRNTLAASATGTTSTGAASGRLSVAWPTANGLAVRTWLGVGWGPTVAVAPPIIPGTYAWFDTPGLALRGAGQAGVAWTACRANCTSSKPTLDLVWSESLDRGATFGHALVIVDGSLGGPVYPENFSPTVVWGSSSQRYVLHAAENFGETYSVQMRSGTGLP
jgi:hypothetical protein